MSRLPMEASAKSVRQPQQQELRFLPMDADANLDDDEPLGASEVVLRGGANLAKGPTAAALEDSFDQCDEARIYSF